jgi:hypothetical protein
VNFTAAVTTVATVATMGATISTEQALAADILDPTTQADITVDTTGADTMEAVGTVVVAMAAAVTAVAAITTNWH